MAFLNLSVNLIKYLNFRGYSPPMQSTWYEVTKNILSIYYIYKHIFLLTLHNLRGAKKQARVLAQAQRCAHTASDERASSAIVAAAGCWQPRVCLSADQRVLQHWSHRLRACASPLIDRHPAVLSARTDPQLLLSDKH